MIRRPVSRSLLAILFMVIAVSGCAPGTMASIGWTVGPAAGASTGPTVECVGGVGQATCDAALPLILAAVAPSGWAPTQVWIDSGSLCPDVRCLFDPNRNFPYPMPPDGGQWIATAEVAFAGTDEHAGMNIAAVGARLVPELIGYRVPLPSWCSGTCPSGSTTDGPFRLELVLPHLEWKASDPITGTAILSYTGSGPTTIAGAGGDLIVFAFGEVGGSRHAEWARTADCTNQRLDPATPINVDLAKSGAETGTEVNRAWLRSFYADPQIHLPAGTWDITAIAVFSDAAWCAGASHTMKVTERVTVSE